MEQDQAMDTGGAGTDVSNESGSQARLLDGLLLIVDAQKRRFPRGLDPFKMLTRLLEECGELATEVQVWEDEGLKRAKHGEPDRERLAGEIVNVLTATLTIANHYDVMLDIAQQVEHTVTRAAAAEPT